MGRCSLVVSLLMLSLCCAFVSLAGATTYYVDSVGGSDGNTGTSSGSPWQTLTKVSTITFAAGDQILLKCGSVWNGQQLWPKGSGSSGNPIVINSYSTGAKPLINGQAAFQEAVKLSNQQYWEINNLEITNWAATAGVYQGLHVLNTDAGTLNHIYLQNLDIHNVNGDMSTGIDRGKGNGGILMEVAGTVTPSKWNDVLIQGCNVHDLSRTCLKFFSSWGSFCTNPTVLLSTNVVVRNCTVTNYTGDGICAHFADGALVEYNVSNGGCTNLDLANVPIWTWDNVNSVLQYNEAYGTVQNRDGMAYDIDGCCSNNVLQYNYSHNNNGGFIMFVSSPDCAAKNFTYVRLPFCSNNTFRYNISQRDMNKVFHFAGKVNDNYVYNNTVYVGAGLLKTVDSLECGDIGPRKQGPVNTFLYNNIIYNTEASGARYTFVGDNYVWDYNVFYGNHPSGEPSDAHKLTSDPLLVNPGSGGTGRLTVDGYKLQAGSPARDSGMTIAGNGGKDYWGNTVPTGSGPDRGANEYVAGGSPPVANFTGNPTSGTAPLTVAFTDASTGSPTSWSWGFGDGGTSTAQNPSHVYAVGTYTVTLTATNAYGSDGETKTNYITASSGGGNPPVAQFVGNPTSGSAPLTVAFTDQSTNSPTSWSWAFGDGSTSTAQNPSHTYAAGTYTVTLTATNQYGSDGETKTNYITATGGGGSAPTFVAAGAMAGGSGAITPALPAGIQTNDILLLFVETANQVITITNPNGGTWTEVAGSPQAIGSTGGSNATRLTAFWSRYNGTQGAPTLADSGNHQLARMIAVRGCVASGNPWNVTAGGTEAADTSGEIPGATTTVANTLVVTAIATSVPDANGNAAFSAWTNANLTGLTERTDDTISASNGGGLGTATGVKTTAGAYGTTTVTVSQSALDATLSIALKP
jgi:PKD repeat protein